MESMSAISGNEWTNEEDDFMAQLLRSCLHPNEDEFWLANESTMSLTGSGDVSANCSLYYFSERAENYYMNDSQLMQQNSNFMSADFCLAEVNNASSYLIERDEYCVKQDISNGDMQDLGPNMPRSTVKWDLELPALGPKMGDKSKKRCRNSKDVPKNKKIAVKTKKNQKLVSSSINEEHNTANQKGKASSSCSEDDSNVSQERGGCSSLNSKEPANGKTRASRGSATDTQSLYAKKRREKINERLRILQNLVPNGTKVDISTMLEEAVQYVKFLNLQIKLLSSDDMWMYAPIAYNGKDIGLDLKIGLST